ncbi:hypothetical protein J437_LFUL011015 [Ladona fulva]|uniref:Uncharacterized protein n=1 Tax=Ladona fulva TaxID=123851 RepID=A0A8K0KLZ8_LADFU|nr:hypothetical protein J437_LFUL011015 [Ladona fulva]
MTDESKDKNSSFPIANARPLHYTPPSPPAKEPKTKEKLNLKGESRGQRNETSQEGSNASANLVTLKKQLEFSKWYEHLGHLNYKDKRGKKSVGTRRGRGRPRLDRTGKPGRPRKIYSSAKIRDCEEQRITSEALDEEGDNSNFIGNQEFAAREVELRTLRKSNTEYEEQNATIQMHIESMRSTVERLEVETLQQRSNNAALQTHLDHLRATLTASFATVPLPDYGSQAVRMPCAFHHGLVCRCNCYGYTGNSYKGKRTCPRCAGDLHDGEPCSSPVKCVNCKGSHPVYAREFPRLQEEKKITELKIIEKMSYADARKTYWELVSPTFSCSYAAVATIKSVGCQTDPCIEKPKDNQIWLEIEGEIPSGSFASVSEPELTISVEVKQKFANALHFCAELLQSNNYIAESVTFPLLDKVKW